MTRLPTAPTALANTTNESGMCPRRLDRRGFLRDTGLAIAAALVGMGMTPGDAFAGTVGEITPELATARERVFAIPTADGVWVDDATHVVLARTQGKLFAFSLECPHKGRLLEWREDEGRFFCPKHKARFSPSGANVGGRRTNALDRFALRRDGNRVISLDTVLSSDGNAAAWAAAVLAV